ncbi:helix-turn-helix domain-containing protein [Xenorhabdus ishibashii]|uniref:Transcriptional regulator n=1 Tax=Xenorhabdus ishibashii TaxID=1034471 RepID=A0A2D0K7X2_9GAMM|nr:helix-turn-helix transcriptional regulator [Xenorhabdus ishibashii]PHM59531.1 transcriptional regulator [Xenorhabdus ishibashii]
MKLKTHKALADKWMNDPEFRAALEEENRKERLQETLQQWRAYKGLTPQELARIMGVNVSTVSRMESNVDKASISTLARYAKACGVENPIIAL